jgi:hypothetical protein
MEVGIGSEEQIGEREAALRSAIAAADSDIAALRNAQRETQTIHAMDELTAQARALGNEIATLDANSEELRTTRERHLRHRNEIEMLGLKFRRSAEAREVLGDVKFVDCPRCAQPLPHHPVGCCEVCGQADQVELADPVEVAALEIDIASRRAELNEAMVAIDVNLAQMHARKAGLVRRKDKIEADLNRVMDEQDTAFLSMALLKERDRAALEAELNSLAWLLTLPQMLQHSDEEQR